MFYDSGIQVINNNTWKIKIKRATSTLENSTVKSNMWRCTYKKNSPKTSAPKSRLRDDMNSYACIRALQEHERLSMRVRYNIRRSLYLKSKKNRNKNRLPVSKTKLMVFSFQKRTC